MTNIEKIIEEFDKEFIENKFCCCSREYCYPGDQTRELILPIKGLLTKAYQAGIQDGREEISKLIDESTKKRTDYLGAIYFDGVVDDIENFLSSKE